MSNQEQVSVNSTFPMEELTRYNQECIKNNDITNPEGTLITSENEDLVCFNGYYALSITTGENKGKQGAFFTIDTNMYVTTVDKISTAKYYLQFILSMDGISSFKIPFKGTFTKLGSGDYELHLKANGVTLNLTFSRSQADTTAEFNGKISIAALGQGESSVSGSTYNNPILPTTYIGTYYDKSKVKTLEVCKHHKLNYRSSDDTTLQRIDAYKFDLNMYVFSFPAPSDSSATINLIMGTSPNSGLVCGDLRTISGSASTQRGLYTIKSPKKVPKINPSSINMSSNKLAPFSAYYSTPTPEYPGAFIAIQATRIPVIDDIDIYEVMVGVSTDGKTSTVYNFDDSMSFDDQTNTLKIPNPAYITDALAPEWITNIKFTREYIKEKKSGHLIKLEGTIMGKVVTTYTPFNLIPLNGFMGAKLTNNLGETLVVNSNDKVTYKGKTVGALLYVPIMYILEFSNPEPPEIDIVGKKYKVVCSFGTDAEQGLACIVTEYTLKDKRVINQVISYYHSVPTPPK